MTRFAREKIKRWLRVLLHTKDSPERTSFAFALGVFIAFLPPVPWFHTIFGLILAFVFRLNRLAVLAGTYTNTPLTILPLFVFEASLGVALLGGREAPELTLRQFATAAGWKDAFQELAPFLWPILLVSVLLGLVGAALAYFIAFRIIIVYRRKGTAAAHAAAAMAGGAVATAAAAAAGVVSRAAPKAKAEAQHRAAAAASAEASGGGSEESAGSGGPPGPRRARAPASAPVDTPESSS